MLNKCTKNLPEEPSCSIVKEHAKDYNYSANPDVATFFCPLECMHCDVLF